MLVSFAEPCFFDLCLPSFSREGKPVGRVELNTVPAPAEFGKPKKMYYSAIVPPLFFKRGETRREG